MRPKLFRSIMVISLAAAALSIAACNKARTDAQVASDIQGRINADQAIHNKQIAVLAASGIVTLSGSVNSEAERSAIAGDAASVSGVRTVVNNLTVEPVDASAALNEPQLPAASQPPPAPSSQPPTASQPATTTRAVSPRNRSSSGQSRTRQYGQGNSPLSQSDATGQQMNANEPAQNAQSVAPPAFTPAPPPAPERINIPDGTVLSVRLLDTLDSETASPGDSFRATLNSPVEVAGRVVIPADADLFGSVVDVRSGKRFEGSALLTLEITKVSFNGRTYRIQSDQWSKQTRGRGRNTAEKVGGGAALGAIIGAIAGGGKGAGIGTAVGAGAGGVTQAATPAPQIKLGSESLLTFHLAQPVTVQPSSYNDRNAGRKRVE